MIKKFMKEKKLNEDSLMNAETKPLIGSITDLLSQAKLRVETQRFSLFLLIYKSHWRRLRLVEMIIIAITAVTILQNW